jgi:hypothetical protein
VSAPHWDVLRRFIRDVAWLVLVGYPLARALTALVLVGYPLARALTALVLAWVSAATDPLGLAR